jgi:hypothetical protein
LMSIVDVRPPPLIGAKKDRLRVSNRSLLSC